MLSDRELFSAKVALGGQPRDAFPNVSRALLAGGNDGPAMRQLAALEGAGSWTDAPALDAALAGNRSSSNQQTLGRAPTSARCS